MSPNISPRGAMRHQPDKYEQYVDGLGLVENEQPCAPGTQIDPITCKCSQLIGKRKIKLVTLKKD